MKPSVTLPKAIMSRLPETNGVGLWETEERGEQLEATVGLSPYFFSSWNLPKRLGMGVERGVMEMREQSRGSEQAGPSSTSHAMPIELRCRFLLKDLLKVPFQVWFPLKEGLSRRKALRGGLTCYRPAPIPISSGLLTEDTV